MPHRGQTDTVGRSYSSRVVMGPSMTFEERATNVGSLGFSARHAQFLVNVALHGGFCLRRQYEAFAGIRYGKNVRDFLETVVKRGFATRLRFQANRGYIYHLHSRAIYRAIGDEDNRNRRAASPAQIARKLMLLDFVLGHRDVRWYATEKEKVELFTQTLGVPLTYLPSRLFSASPDGPSTARYFVDKLPIGIGDDHVVEFVFLSCDGRAPAFCSFLRDHARLFDALPAWRVIVVGPRSWPGLESVFRRFRPLDPIQKLSLPDVRWCFELRKLLDANQTTHVPVRDIQRYRDITRTFPIAETDELYARWLSEGEPALIAATDKASAALRGNVVIEALPFSYDQFGSFPGVA